MKPIIPDTSPDARMTGLEQFLERYLEPRRPEFGVPESELQSIKMPDPLRRFFRFAGRWPGQNPRSAYANRFCMQDALGAIRKNEYAPALEVMDKRLVFVWENQGVWVAATERVGADASVWISENCSHREARRKWRRLEKFLSHFLVSFVLQELMFGSPTGAAAPGVLEKFEGAGLPVEPVWIRGEYAWGIDRPSYFLADGRFLVRRAPEEADGHDWYGCMSSEGAELLASLDLPTRVP